MIQSVEMDDLGAKVCAEKRKKFHKLFSNEPKREPLFIHTCKQTLPPMENPKRARN